MKKTKAIISVFIILVSAIFLNLQAQPLQTPSPKMTAANELFQQKKFQEAAQAFGDIIKDEPKNGRAWYFMGMSLHSLGQWEQAISAFEKNVAIANNPSSMYNIACEYSQLNQTDKAFEWLEKALTNGAAFSTNIETDTDLENIRKDARFKKMIDIADRQKRPCIYSEQARQFDFWLGDWEVFNTAGQKAGTNTVQSFSNGCGLMENWTSSLGGDGKSINYYDASTGRWYQHWIGSGGGALRYAGSFKDGAMRFEGETIASGKKTLQKLTFTKLDENTVRQVFEASNDDGKTWAVTTDLKYIRKK